MTTVKILLIGDIVGKPGRLALAHHLPRLRQRYQADFCLVNAENAAGGKGITPPLAEEMFRLGADVLTLGNHAWDNKDIIPLLDQEERLLRPANYPPEGVTGKGIFHTQLAWGLPVTVIHLVGRVFMPPVDCPFRKAKELLANLSRPRIILVDFHAEATSEKEALGLHLDGQVTVLAGTHTHVQTADEMILPGGTGYITDLGMTGPYLSIIGMRPQEAMKRFLTGMKAHYEVAKGPAKLCGLFLEADPQTGRCTHLERIQFESEAADDGTDEKEG